MPVLLLVSGSEAIYKDAGTGPFAYPHTALGGAESNAVLNVYVFVEHGITDGTQEVATLTYGGVDLTYVGSIKMGAAQTYTEDLHHYVLMDADIASGENDLVVDFVVDGWDHTLEVMTYENVDQTTPFGTPASVNLGNTASGVMNYTNTDANAIILAAALHVGNGAEPFTPSVSDGTNIEIHDDAWEPTDPDHYGFSAWNGYLVPGAADTWQMGGVWFANAGNSPRQSLVYAVEMFPVAGGTPVSKTLIANIEALAGISVGRTFNFESLQLLQQAFTGNIEALKETGQTTPVNIESLMRVGQVIPLNLEALKGIEQTYVGGIEALKGIAHISPVNIEALGRIDQTAIINIEARGFALITATAVIPVESLQQVTRTPEISVEALQAISQGVSVQIESLGYIQRTGSGNIEALAFISHDATANLESLKAIAGTATLSFEALKTIAKVAQVPIEALQGATVNVIVDVVERTAYFSITLARDITFNKTVAKEATFNKTVTKNVKFH